MRRRKFVAAIGSLTAGAGAVLGTGASNTFNVQDRAAKINITADGSTGVVGLLDNSAGDIVNATNDSGNADKLEIDFAEHPGSDGVPLDTVVQLGDLRGNPQGAIPNFGNDDWAFGIANYAAGQDLDISITFEAASGFNVVSDGSFYQLGGRGPTGSNLSQQRPFESRSGSGGAGNATGNVNVFDENTTPGDFLTFDNIPTLSPGEVHKMGMIVNTEGGAESEDLSTNITITANSV
jgi:hypothetical protein